MKKIFIRIFSLVTFVFGLGCASTAPVKNMVNAQKKSTKKKDEQDVKSLDLSYSKGMNQSSEKRGRYSCESYQKLKKTEWKKYLEAGLSCIYEKKWDELEKIATTLSHHHLKAPWGPYYKSLVSSERDRDYMRSLWMIDLARKKAPKNSIILFQKARLHWFLGEHSASYDLMKKVLKLNPNQTEASYFLGNLYYRDKDFKETLSYFKKIYPYKKRNPQYRAAYAESLFYLGKKKESVDHYKAAIALLKDDGFFYYRLGQVYKDLKEWSKSRRYYTKSLRKLKQNRVPSSVNSVSIEREIQFVNKKIQEEKEKKNEKKS